LENGIKERKIYYLAAAASWFLAFGAEGSAETYLAVVRSSEDVTETLCREIIIWLRTSVSWTIKYAFSD